MVEKDLAGRAILFGGLAVLGWQLFSARVIKSSKGFEVTDETLSRISNPIELSFASLALPIVQEFGCQLLYERFQIFPTIRERKEAGVTKGFGTTPDYTIRYPGAGIVAAFEVGRNVVTSQHKQTQKFIMGAAGNYWETIYHQFSGEDVQSLESDSAILVGIIQTAISRAR